ncbi:hypothetical protein [Ralstonia pseudosolanacearum]|uniref:hypothetical protein n=1 Tax=Ralstonia pseudosolanacearum TaxID=1310165 RepID=UPI001FFB50EE|nr:hypothetical protein [Ralstonia pseudosolanacearum]
MAQDLPQIPQPAIDYYLQRWTQLNGLVISHSEGALTYLLTVNGGALAGVLAFVGAVQQVRQAPGALWALLLFAVGLVLAGLTRTYSLETMKALQRGWVADFEQYRSGKITWDVFIEQDSNRVRRWDRLGPWLGWSSFLCFLVGLAVASVLLFSLPK